MKNGITLKETLQGKALVDLIDFAWAILGMKDVEGLEKEPLVDRIVERFNRDVFAAAMDDIVMTEIELEDYFIGMIEDGEARIPKEDEEAIAVFKRMAFVDVREVKRGNGTSIVATMADEVREAILADYPRYEELRCLKDDLNFYANSAALLYGVVTLKEICELYRRWNPDTRLTEEIVRMVLDYTQMYDEAEFFLYGDRVCNLEFNAERETDGIIAHFMAERDRHPRWYPDDEASFLNFCEESAHLVTDEAHALDAFLEKHGLEDFQERTDLLYAIIQKHQFEERISPIISLVVESCKLKDESDANGLISVLVPFLNTTHLRVLNGWTPDALHESFMAPAVSTKPVAGRNAPCPCGSGLKYKKCCGRVR